MKYKTLLALGVFTLFFIWFNDSGEQASLVAIQKENVKLPGKAIKKDRAPSSTSEHVHSVQKEGTQEESHSGRMRHRHNHFSHNSLSSKPKTFEQDSLPLEKAMPSVETVKKELQKGRSHRTPESLARFGKLVARQLVKALNDEKAASELVKQLKSCAIDEHQPTTLSVRAFCIKQARRLQLAHPELKSDIEEIERQAPQKALQFARY